MINILRPGITTLRLDEEAGKCLKLMKARSAPRLHGFPGNTCISVNEIIAHGIPDKRILRCGDRINIDVSAEYNGYYGDVAYTLIIGDHHHETSKLLESAKNATMTAIELSVAGTPVNQIAATFEKKVRAEGFTIIKNLCSHGVGRQLHTWPANILNYYDSEETIELEKDMVIAWEPYVSTGAVRAISDHGEWNLTTHNASDVAQFEHTILVTDNKPEILTILE